MQRQRIHPTHFRTILWGILLGLFAFAACGADPDLVTTVDPEVPETAQRLLEPGVRLYVEPDSSPHRQAEAWRVTRPDDAARMDDLAAQPNAEWFGEWSGDIRVAVDRRVSEIHAAGALPVMVAYNIPARDCGSYSAGGSNSAAGYEAWIRDFAAGIGDRPAVVILEPDAVAGITCLAKADQTIRYDLLATAVDTLQAQPNVDVYIDAGHSDWVPAKEMAGRLTQAGIARARGFSLNVSNFQTTPDLIAYGKRVSAAIDSPTPVHFVIDTSRNGNGPLPANQDPTGEAWCNPPGRALGQRPTVNTGEPLVDAFLWIKRPGESDGTCKGGPAAGQWWPEYALELVVNASR